MRKTTVYKIELLQKLQQLKKRKSNVQKMHIAN